MKSTPKFEKITPAYGSSVHMKQYSDKLRDKKPFWHIHPEIELVYVNGFRDEVTGSQRNPIIKMAT